MAEGSERKQAGAIGAPHAPPHPHPHPRPPLPGGGEEKRHKRVGTTVRGKYTIDAFLATGTMANVYASTHRNGSRVALKILHKQLSVDEGLCERFKREGYFANSIGHPGVVRAIDDDVTEDGCPFLVMELLEGETLEERRRRKGGKLPAAWVLPIAETLLEILAAAHAREVVHRDLKPDNVFITRDGDVKVLDFGVARWNDGKTSSDMTAMGMVLGTPAYMPPEQALGRREDVDAQSDLWAIGATLFIVLSGESVHEGGDAKAKLIATARTAARPLSDAAPEIPRSVAAVIDRALAFHKHERWADAEAMREALRWARLGIQDRPLPAGPPQSTLVVPEPIPLPTETKRNFDEEPTLAIVRDDPKPVPSSPAPSSSFLTSAPPITMRNGPRVAHTLVSNGSNGLAVDPAEAMANALSGIASEPIFSLRREKDGGTPSGSIDVSLGSTPHSGSPSTARLAAEASLRTTAPLGAPSPSPALRTVPGIGALPVSAAPITAPIVPEPPHEDTTAVLAAPKASSEEPRSVELNMSFTRPMAAMVLPSDWPQPRPAAGEPPDAPERPDPDFGLARAPTMMAQTASMPADAFPLTYPPPPLVPSNYPPSALASPQVGVTTIPAQRFQHDTPGPVLSSIVAPRSGRFVRIFVPLLVASVAVGGILFFLRLRAARARAMITQSVQTAQIAPATSATPSGAPADSASPVASPAASASVAASAIAAADAPPPAPKKKKKKKPKPPPVESAEVAPDPDPPPMDPPPFIPGDTGGN